MNRKTQKQLTVLIPTMVTALACTCIPTGIGQTPAAPPADILYEDDFGDPGSGWEQGDYDVGSASYEDGIYSVIAHEESIMWGTGSLSFENLIIEADATQFTAPANDNTAYGVICREQGDDYGSGYYLLISGDGGYAIYKGEGEDLEALVDWTASDAIRQGNNATNRIRAICDGPTLTLFANGTRLATAEDTTYTKGDIGLMAASFESTAPAEIHFDNLIVRRP